MAFDCNLLRALKFINIQILSCKNDRKFLYELHLYVHQAGSFQLVESIEDIL